MQLKTVSSIGLAFLLVVGVVGVASAQDVSPTPGILIRVDNRPPIRGRKLTTKLSFGSWRLTRDLMWISVAVLDSAAAKSTPLALWLECNRFFE